MMKHQKYENTIDQALHQIENLPWTDKNFYSQFLKQTYFFVSHSTRLLARTMSLTPTKETKRYSRFVEHMTEEHNHEVIAWADLKGIGVDPNSLEELPTTKAFYGLQYYKADISSGISLLGYILFLEAIASRLGAPFMTRLKEAHGVKGTRFLHVHTTEDPEHVEHALEQISLLSLNEQKIVWENFNDTAILYVNLLDEIAKNSQINKFNLHKAS